MAAFRKATLPKSRPSTRALPVRAGRATDPTGRKKAFGSALGAGAACERMTIPARDMSTTFILIMVVLDTGCFCSNY